MDLSFRRGFLGLWDGLAGPAMVAVAMVSCDVPWFDTCKILHVQLRAIIFSLDFNYSNLRFFCGHCTYTTRTIGNLLPPFLRDLSFNPYSFQP